MEKFEWRAIAVRWAVFVFAAFWLASAPAQTYCVRHNSTELKKSPLPKAPTSWRVGKYMPLQGTGVKKKNYVQVRDLDGEEHWARKRDLYVTTNCLVIKVRQTILRTGPGSGFPQALMASFDKYSPLKDLGGESGWTRVEDDTGAQGWVNLDHTWKPIQGRIRLSFERTSQ